MRTLGLLLAAALASSLASCASQDVSAVAPVLAGADIVILGEVHDNPTHHHNQAALIIDLAPAAVAFEMLSPAQAAIVNRHRDRGDVLRDALDWGSSGWPDWSLYQPVFAALGDTPAYGMALPYEEVSRAVNEGAAAVFGDEAGRFGLDTPLPVAQQQARESHQQESHCNMLPESILGGMVEAQRLRDAAFSRTTLQALAERGGPVVVVTGTGHARADWGMPAVLQVAAPAVKVASLGQFEAAPDTSAPFDTWLVATPAPRDDPCAAFAGRE